MLDYIVMQMRKVNREKGYSKAFVVYCSKQLLQENYSRHIY